MPGAVETVKLQVELVEKNAEARLKALDKLAKEMANRKISLQFDEESLAKWKAATNKMTALQLNAYTKVVLEQQRMTLRAANEIQQATIQSETKKAQAQAAASAKETAAAEAASAKKVAAEEAASAKRTAAIEKTAQADIAAAAKIVAAQQAASAKKTAAEEKSAQVEMQINAKLVAERQKSFDKKVALYEQEDTKRRAIAAKTEQTEINANAKVEAAQLKSANATRTHTAAEQELGSAASKTSGIFDGLTQRFTAANLISSLITAAISKLKQAIREAVNEMKEMDKELTTIKMVSGASDSYINQLTEQAFAGARANGRNVTDYLSAAEIFTRAGYRDNIDQLSQLALMTENIGGVEEEVASKFLLAADAAWKLGGSYDALLGVLDGVSSVADQNATDLGKIAEGITVAGSAFANAGESAATFTAMLGVTTASTQRSGSEMARGLRTILFRVRQVKAEFDDGEVVDAKSISNAAKALDSVGISVLDKTGDLKSMSQIMTELSQKWGQLSKAEQAYLQNYLAGNRNGNVLFALMDNWDKYEEMLSQYENSAGTAVEKNAIYTESWAAASENLKTSWTDFISTLTANGGVIQAFLEDITGILDKINNSAALDSFGNAFKFIVDNRGKLKESIEGLFETEDGVGVKFETRFGTFTRYLGKFLDFIIPEETEAAKEATDGIKDYSEAVEGAGESADEASDGVETLTTAFKKQKDAIDAVKKAIKEEGSDAVNSMADIYKAMNEAAEKGYFGSNAFQKGGALFFSEDILRDIKNGKNNPVKQAMDAYIEGIKGGDYSNPAAQLFKALTDGSNEIKGANGELLASVRDIGDAYEWTFNKGMMGMDEYLNSLSQQTGIGEEFWASMIESLGMYSDELADWALENSQASTEAEFEDEAAKTEIEQYMDLLASIPSEVQTVVRTIYASTGDLGKVSQVADIQTRGWNLTDYWRGKGYAGGKHDNYSGIALVNDEYPANGSKPELIISNSTGRAYIANGGYPALVNLGANDTVLSSSETKRAFGVPGYWGGRGIDLFTRPMVDLFGEGSITTLTPKDATSGGSGGGGGGGGTTVDASNSWATLKKLIDYLLDKGEDDLKDQLKVLDDQLAELEAERKAQEESNKLQEKQEAVQQALLDLEKAQVERTVRYYNEETQQWEWMADQGAVQKAQEAYDEALKDLNEYLADQDYEARKAEIQARKEELQAQFDAYKDSWSAIIDAIEAPAGDIKALLEEVKKYGTSTMVAQSGGIAELLNNLRDGLVSLGYLFGLGNINANTSNSSTNENTVFDSGGFAFGSGYMRKGAVGAEAVIGPDITRDILNPVRNANFATFADSVRTLVGASNMIAANGGSYVTNNSGGNIIVNGIKIGEDMMQKPFAEVMRTISLHVNEAV